MAGLPGVVITIIAMTVAPAIAATAPAGKPSPPAGTVSAAPAHTAPATYPAPRKQVSRIHSDTSCDDSFVILWSFSASATTVPTGTADTLTATMTCDIGPTPYWLQIFDTTTGALVGYSGAGTSYSVAVTQGTASTHNYIAYVGPWISSYPPASVFEQSLNIYVTWEAPPNNFVVSLSGPASVDFYATSATYTATVNQNVGPTPYWIEIFDETTGSWLAACGTGTTCSVSFLPAMSPGDDLVAFVSSYGGSLPPAGAQASSNVLGTVRQELIQ